MNTTSLDTCAATPVVDLQQLESACDGDGQLMRDLIDLYFGQADQIMTALGPAIEAGDIGEVDHLSHKLAGSSLACGMSAPVPSLRQLEHNAKAGHLQGAPDWFAQATSQLEAVRQFMQDYFRQNPPK